METENSVSDESPAQAALAILRSLEFLSREAEAAGMPEVSELIEKARKKAKEWI